MLAGSLYDPGDPELVAMRRQARRLTRLYNATTEAEIPRRQELIRQLLGATGRRFEIEPPFQVDYGRHIHVGEGFYANFGCVILDCAPVRIGNGVLLAPGVHIYTAHHPLDPSLRIRPDFSPGEELASPVTIGHRVWIGGGTILCPGVTIGDNTVIGAGSVVTKDIPPGVLAVGNPCRVVRTIA